MLKNLPIRYQLLLHYSMIFTLTLSLGSVFIYVIIQRTIKANIESELAHTTQAIHNMVKTAADVSIKNRLRAIAEKNLETARYFYSQYRSGLISERTAKDIVAGLFLNQSVGNSGYTYCIDSAGIVRIHPEKELIDVCVAEHAFVQRQMQLKEGYINYQWKNPGETRSRPKTLYMTYFQPWDWIISVSSYRREFKDLVKVDDFKDSILRFRFGQTGYSFIVDRKGNTVVHPELQGVNILASDLLPGKYFDIMLRQPSGQVIYPWKNPKDNHKREKLVIFNTIPEYDWIVASSSYLDEFYQPLKTIEKSILAIILITLGMTIALSFHISASITNPLKKLMNHFHHVRGSDFSVRMERGSNDEIGQLAEYFNAFMDQLERYSKDLKKEIDNRIAVEKELRESEGRYRSVMEAAPDPIVVYNMIGEVIYFNPAFSRVFGWSLDECVGRKMDHFVPDENWPETRKMIQAVLSEEPLSFVETRRLNKSGRIVPVSISGATYRDLHGQPAGSVIILVDITKTHRLRKLVMDTAERERQKFGQDLHDDLCPHMIGIQGLCTVLAENLKEDDSPHASLASKILTTVEIATDKTRALARGLCPVYLVSPGLYAALEDLAARTSNMSGIPCHFTTVEPIDVSDTTVATHLYYIAQEAVLNAVKHADAALITIGLWHDGRTLNLSVADNGRGFEESRAVKGIGLQIIKYRANILGATLNIESLAGTGTTLHVVLEE